MVHILSRTRKLRELLWIRVGPGALLLPKEVTKIGMEFNMKIDGGHRGAKKFWREMLPRIKYRNPALPVEICRHRNANGPSLLHIYTKSSSLPSSTPITGASPTDTILSGTPDARNTPTSDASEPTHTIDVRMKSESEILDALIEKTGATVMKPTEQELEEIQEIRDFKERSEKDRVEVREKLLNERREQELLKLARGEVPTTN